ncbi:transcriptional regulator [Nocardiopsis sp. NRRL B-16309]|nr:transcriptional regulator [Nocardiopsis sp. NRRL B-16309]
MWIGNPIAQSATTTVVDLVQQKVTGRRDQRRLERRFAEIEESIADRIVSYLDHEFRGLPENEREAAVLAVADAFERAGLTDRTLFEQDLDPLYLERYIRDRNPHATRDLSGAAVALYDRVLPESCAYVLATVSTLPNLQTGAFTELLRREALILEHLEEVLDRIPRRPEGLDEDPEAAFETAYRRKAAERWDVLELFGTDAHTRPYRLSVAYLSLCVRGWPEQGSSGGPDEPGDRQVEQVLATRSRTFLRGPAGAGKTTLLRWAAVRASRSDFPDEMSAWNGLIPFLIPLRQYVGQRLPEPEDFLRQTGRHLAYQAPSGWVTSVLADGRAIVLIDGIDELPPGEREDARRWLRDLLADFPDCRYIVTTRPGAASETWLDADGFASAELQSLREGDVRAFIHHWHEAVRGDIADQDERDRLTGFEHELIQKVLNQRHLRAIASTPLLCALLCALYRDRNTSLPRDRMEVYEAALAMLLKDRDQQRGIEGIDLSRRELVLLLQELAKWLILNGSSDAPIPTVRRQVARLLAAMHGVREDPEEVFAHLVVRSGLLQCPTVDRVGFLHRTFEEYLAARALVEEDSFPLLIRHAHDDQWHEVVVMAAGHCTPAQREELVTGLLERSGQVKRHRDRLLLVAFACLETSPALSQDLSEDIRARVRSILPPRTKDHVHALSMVGEYALPLLATVPPQNARQAAKSIEAASTIGGPSAVPVIERALAFGSESVMLAAQRAWLNEPSEELARVLFPRFEERRPHYYIPVAADRAGWQARYMPGNRRASVEGANGDDLDGLSGLTALTFVDLRNRSGTQWHGIDLAPLASLPSLIQLDIDGDASAERIAPLAACPITFLELSHPEHTRDLTYVRELETLRHLCFTRALPSIPLGELVPDRGLESFGLRRVRLRDLRYLAGAPNTVHSLDVMMCPALMSFAGLESQTASLSKLSLRQFDSRHASLEPLASLESLSALRVDRWTWELVGNAHWITRVPHLRKLYLDFGLRTPATVPDWVRELPYLVELCLEAENPLSLQALAGAENLTVHVRQRTKVLGADRLGTGSSLLRAPGNSLPPW